jgi:hypothetical protein
LKMSAVICGKSAVVFPAAFASSIGSFFSQPKNVRDRQAPRQIPTRVRRRRPRVAWRNAFTEALLISLRRVVRQDNSGSQEDWPSFLVLRARPRPSAKTKSRRRTRSCRSLRIIRRIPLRLERRCNPCCAPLPEISGWRRGQPRHNGE